jgi:hypothetical protein
MIVYGRNILVLLIGILSLFGHMVGDLAEAGGNWPNEPPGSTVVVDCPFSGSLCPPMFNVYNTASFTSDSKAPMSPGGVFDTYLDAGSITGNGQWGATLPKAREVFLGTWWSTNADFQGIANNGNKMLFIRAPSSGDNSFLVWQGPPNTARTLKWDMQAIYSNAHVSGWAGDPSGLSGWFEPNGPSNGIVSPGSGWHKIEIYLKASTTGTSRDGIVRWWLDGVLVGSYNNVNLAPGGYEDFQINHTWDGSGIFSASYRDMSKAWHHYWDHLYISVRQGGSSADQPAGPPAAPRIAGITVH